MKVSVAMATVTAASIILLGNAAHARRPTPPTPEPSVSPSPSPSASAYPYVGSQPYDKFSAAAMPQPGLFTVWRSKGMVYFEIRPDQLDTPYLLVPVLTSGLGALAPGSSFSVTNSDSFVVRFHRAENKIIVEERNTFDQARPHTPGKRASASVYPLSVLAASDIATVNPGNGDIVFPAEVLLTDIVDLTDGLNPRRQMESGAHYHLDSKLSYFGPSKAFPRNVDVESDLTFTSGERGPIDFVPDSRSLFFRLHYSIVELPHDGYRPRLADDRLGYFITARRQYDTYRGPTSFVRYIDRWNVQKRDPAARVSPAKTPIVFYLSDTIPAQYRAPIRNAILTWNKAFESIGISGAIEVRPQPNDPAWDPEDVRYSVVRWILPANPEYGAFGAHLSDPYTGEIFRADLVIDGNIMRRIGINYDAFVAGTRAQPAADDLACLRRDCDFAYAEADQAAWGALSMLVDKKLGSTGEAPDWYKRQFLRSIVLHEVGHTLGLRHNFAGSMVYTLKQVRNKNFTRSHGLSNSVMEYLPLNLSPRGQPQGDYFQLVLGPWDYYSIRYGYVPIAASSTQAERPALQHIAAQSTRPDLLYATDEDSSWADGFATDPRDTAFDLSNDPLAYCQSVFAIDRRLFGALPYRLPRPGRSYEDNRAAFQILMASFARAGGIATHYIGGEYFSRNHRGDPNARLPFAPVPRAQEKRAFDLLSDYIFADDAFQFTPRLLNSLGSTRFAHWESDPNALGTLTFPVEDFVQGYQLQLLLQMWQPSVLDRLDTLQARVTDPRQTMSLADLYDWTDQAVWSDLSEPGLRSVPLVHRALQQRYASLLEHLMLNPDPGTPLDAMALARHHLVWVRHELDVALQRGGLDEATQANLEQVQASVDKALSANVVIPAP